MNIEGTVTGRFYHVTRTLDGRKIDKLSPEELRRELRAMIEEAARLERAAVCFHEDMHSVNYVDAGNPAQEVSVYTCRNCKFSWSD